MTKTHDKFVNMMIGVAIIVIIALALCGCNGTQDYGYGVACDQNGHLSEIIIRRDGTVNSVQQGDMNPAAQTCRVQEDGSIIITNKKMP